MDMRNGSVTAGGPDGLRFMVLFGQLCRRWGLPSVGMSFGGDSKDRVPPLPEDVLAGMRVIVETRRATPVAG